MRVVFASNKTNHHWNKAARTTHLCEGWYECWMEETKKKNQQIKRNPNHTPIHIFSSCLQYLLPLHTLLYVVFISYYYCYYYFYLFFRSHTCYYYYHFIYDESCLPCFKSMKKNSYFCSLISVQLFSFLFLAAFSRIHKFLLRREYLWTSDTDFSSSHHHHQP